jgi:dimethylargininase
LNFVQANSNMNTMNPFPLALTRAVSPLLGDCELTHIEREPIDIRLAEQQHGDYEQALEQMGYTIRRLPEAPHLPDGVFVEDTAVVFPEVAVITRPGAESRRPETGSMADVLGEYRELHFISEPGTMDGGDILVLGKSVYTGLSQRTNTDGVQQLADILKPFSYSVTGVPVSGCLHLKTGIAPIEPGLLLINPEWIDESLFPGYRCEAIHPDEPYGANVMMRGNKALCPAAFPHTVDWLEKRGFEVIVIDQSEMKKAEAGLTCCSVIVE